ncbi:hypothetical protein BB8028_0005g10240 [Beauveria bassiana]|uniref:N-glycosylation protein EOS1 n=1 Tax=Beauveria bassiana TaxID=176275 RepID=A0A2S7YH45_BEABA|nr:hypothetical protein BB8028_0005g10240 [Beauveria bassiana]
MVVGGQLHGALPSPSSPRPPSTPTSSTTSTIAATTDLDDDDDDNPHTITTRSRARTATAGAGAGLASPPRSRPPRYTTTTTTTATSKGSSLRNDTTTTAAAAATTDTTPADRRPPVHPSMLQPRVAVVLNVPPMWHPWLFALRLLSCLPAAWWGLPSALHLLLRFLPRPEHDAFASLYRGDGWSEPYALTETALATIWSFACGYLSFFFTDCLMSRWLINYTPQATIVRLLTIDVINAYLTLTTLSLCGGFQDPRLLLPGWIGIATTLTVCYHISHQRINIRKETSTSVNVFSIASYLSMVALLAHLLAFQPDYPAMPVIVRARRFWNDALHYVAQVKGTIERERAEL